MLIGSNGMKASLAFIIIVIVVVAGVWLFMRKRSAVDRSMHEPSPSSDNMESGFSPPPASPRTMETKDGLTITDIAVGTGQEATSGMTLSVNYIGTLENGQKFDSSYDRGQPFQFVLGAGQVIRGWDVGFEGMKVGGKRRLVVPAALAYGDRGAGNGLIPPGATLVFEVELLAVQQTQ